MEQGLETYLRLVRASLWGLCIVLAIAMHSPVHADALQTLRDCESGSDYAAISDNGLYFGAYQFSLGTWYTVGGTGMPNEASPEEQDYRAWLLLHNYGAHHWPICGIGVQAE